MSASRLEAAAAPVPLGETSPAPAHPLGRRLVGTLPIRESLDNALVRVSPLGLGSRWLAGAAAAGTLPLLLFWALGLPGQRYVTALCLFPFFLSLVLRDRQRPGFATVLVAFSLHSILAIALAALDPAGAARVLEDGEGYWLKNIGWITTGVDPEYQVVNWLPAHAQQLASMVLFAVTSLGLVPLAQGLYEIDLMNFYVGRLVAESASAWIALLVGWHTWAILRGVAYTRIVYETASLTLERITGRVLSTPSRRLRRWGVGLSLLVLDGLLKWLLLERVRVLLHDNLLPRL